MTRDELIKQIDRLNKLVGSMHNQVNGMAARESDAAKVQAPHPYQNEALTNAKDSLIQMAGVLVEQAKQL